MYYYFKYKSKYLKVIKFLNVYLLRLQILFQPNISAKVTHL